MDSPPPWPVHDVFICRPCQPVLVEHRWCDWMHSNEAASSGWEICVEMCKCSNAKWSLKRICLCACSSLSQRSKVVATNQAGHHSIPSVGFNSVSFHKNVDRDVQSARPISDESCLLLPPTFFSPRICRPFFLVFALWNSLWRFAPQANRS